MSSTIREFGLIGSALWHSQRFQSVKTLDAGLAYIWFHTSQKTCAGVLRLGPAYAYDELDFITSLEDASQVFEHLHQAELINVIKPFVIVRGFLRFNPVKTYRHAIGALAEVLALPNCGVKTELIGELRRSKGVRDLLHWRDKNGEPHKVVFALHEYLGCDESEPLANPSLTPSEPFTYPSGIRKNESTNEKGEMRKETTFSAHAPANQLIESGGFAAKRAMDGGPFPETIAAAQRLAANKRIG